MGNKISNNLEDEFVFIPKENKQINPMIIIENYKEEDFLILAKQSFGHISERYMILWYLNEMIKGSKFNQIPFGTKLPISDESLEKLHPNEIRIIKIEREYARKCDRILVLADVKNWLLDLNNVPIPKRYLDDKTILSYLLRV